METNIWDLVVVVGVLVVSTLAFFGCNCVRLVWLWLRVWLCRFSSVSAPFGCGCGCGCWWGSVLAFLVVLVCLAVFGLIWRWLCFGCLRVLRLFCELRFVCCCFLLWLYCGCVGLVQHWRCLFSLTLFVSDCGIGCVF